MPSPLSKLRVAWLILLPGLLLPRPAGAVEAAPVLTDREIAERLARLEERQAGLRTEIKHLREDMNQQNELLRTTNMIEQFARQFHLTLVCWPP